MALRSRRVRAPRFGRWMKRAACHSRLTGSGAGKRTASSDSGRAKSSGPIRCSARIVGRWACCALRGKSAGHFSGHARPFQSVHTNLPPLCQHCQFSPCAEHRRNGAIPSPHSPRQLCQKAARSGYRFAGSINTATRSAQISEAIGGTPDTVPTASFRRNRPNSDINPSGEATDIPQFRRNGAVPIYIRTAFGNSAAR